MEEKNPFAAQLAESRDGSFVLCVACSKIGHCRLGITSSRLVSQDSLSKDQGRVRSITQVKCPGEYEGGPGVAHGGWTASVLDEMFGHLALLRGLFTVTSSLTVDYLKPVPVERDLEGIVWVESITDGRWKVAGELRLAATGKVLSHAHGLFIQRDLSHFQRHEKWLAEQLVEKAGG